QREVRWHLERIPSNFVKETCSLVGLVVLFRPKIDFNHLIASKDSVVSLQLTVYVESLDFRCLSSNRICNLVVTVLSTGRSLPIHRNLGVVMGQCDVHHISGQPLGVAKNISLVMAIRTSCLLTCKSSSHCILHLTSEFRGPLPRYGIVSDLANQSNPEQITHFSTHPPCHP
ncbi:hypothetical protein QQP08_023783, partial [Theobroma cacao]